MSAQTYHIIFREYISDDGADSESDINSEE